VAVLWMLAALAALASAYSMFAINTAASIYLPEQRVKADAAIRAAIELTVYRQLAWPNAARPSRGVFAAKLGAIAINVDYRAESARIDLNAARRDLLTGLFAKVGATSTTAEYLADRIVAWRKRLTEAERRSEQTIYNQAGLSYSAAGAPFDNVLELAALPRMSPQLLARALPYLTVYNGSGAIDPQIADPLVLGAIPGMTPKIESALTAAVTGRRPDAMTLATIAGPTSDYIGIESNDTIRARVIVTFPGRKIAAEVVVIVTTGANADEPYQILYWRDDLNGQPIYR
jgi:general secretion pathway protein K